GGRSEVERKSSSPAMTTAYRGWGENSVYGALRLDLAPGLARFRLVAGVGRALDSGRVRCRS
ncbi:MAG: hypothetical protein C4305_08190, partial [Thermoleophilia bacterium]